MSQITFRAGDLEELCKVIISGLCSADSSHGFSWRVAKSENKGCILFEKHLKAINAELHGRFFYSSYGLFILCVFPFSFLLFVFFINLQYFQVQARVLAHGSYTLAKKPFDKSAVYNDLESKKNDPTGTDGTINKGWGITIACSILRGSCYT